MLLAHFAVVLALVITFAALVGGMYLVSYGFRFWQGGEGSVSRRGLWLLLLGYFGILLFIFNVTFGLPSLPNFMRSLGIDNAPAIIKRSALITLGLSLIALLGWGIWRVKTGRDPIERLIVGIVLVASCLYISFVL